MVEEYKKLTDEINKIDKATNMITDAETSTCFTLQVTDVKKMKENELRTMGDDKGSYSIGDMIKNVIERFESEGDMMEQEIKDTQVRVHAHLESANILEILGIILRDLTARRASLKKRMEDLGINTD